MQREQLAPTVELSVYLLNGNESSESYITHCIFDEEGIWQYGIGCFLIFQIISISLSVI